MHLVLRGPAAKYRWYVRHGVKQKMCSIWFSFHGFLSRGTVETVKKRTRWCVLVCPLYVFFPYFAVRYG